LLNEVEDIKVQSRKFSDLNKDEFLKKMEQFQNSFISAQNAKESKSTFFEKIIQSDLASIEFRFLIRHLTSRMSNLHNTTVIIERKLELARNTYQAKVDASLTEYSRQLDSLMKLFSSISILFLPLTLISGMWGMNCKVPFQDVNSLWPFSVVCSAMLIIMVSFYLFFRWKKWM